MTRGPCTFRQQDVTRAIRAVRAAGLPVSVTVDPQTGAITIATVEAAAQDSTTPLDQWMAGHANKAERN
jgi:hypothetical protein